MLSENQLKAIIKDVVDSGSNLIQERGMGAMGPLMGAAMSKVRGKAKPQMVQKLLQDALKREIS
jgi:glutamyl-tRNA(Gln) amidotransferase subunit E